jgi:catechol 2,3-dioxygenase-like lactoylglutathione lyase family enzyme
MIKYRHTGIVVNNIQKSKKFYCGLLKLKVLQELEETGPYFNRLIKSKNLQAKVVKAVSEDNIYVELIEFHGAKKKNKIYKKFNLVGKIHLCFTVNNIDKLYIKLKKKKISFLSKPLSSIYDKVKTCFCYDPDFNLVQFVEGENLKKKLNLKNNE